MTDIVLTVGIDESLSYEEMRKGLERVLGKLSSNPLKIPIKPELEQVEMQAFRKQMTELLSSVAESAKTSVQPLQEISAMVTELSKKPFALNMNISEANSAAEALGRYREQVREYVREMRDAYNAIGQITGDNRWRTAVGDSMNRELAGLYGGVGLKEIEKFEQRLERATSFAGAERIAKDAQQYWNALMPILNKAQEIGIIAADSKFGIFPEIPQQNVDTAQRLSGVLENLFGATKQETAGAQQLNAEMQEHVQAVEGAAEAERMKEHASEDLQHDLEQENRDLNNGDDSLQRHASLFREVANASKQAHDLLQKNMNAGDMGTQAFDTLNRDLQLLDQLLLASDDDVNDFQNNIKRLSQAGYDVHGSLQSVLDMIAALRRNLTEAERGGSVTLSSLQSKAQQMQRLLDSNTRLRGEREYVDLQNELNVLNSIIANVRTGALTLDTALVNAGRDGAQIMGELNTKIAEFSNFADVASRNSKALESMQQMLDQASLRLNHLRSAATGSGVIANTQDVQALQIAYDTLSATLARLMRNRGALTQEEIYAARREAEAVRQRIIDTQVIEQGTQQQYTALQNVNAMIERVRKNQEAWSAARNGKSQYAYNELTTYIAQLSNLQGRLEQGTITAGEFNREFRRIAMGVSGAGAAIAQAGENTKSFADRMRGLAQKFSAWLGASQLIMRTITAVRKLINETIVLDDALTQLRIVTHGSTADMRAYGEQAIATAKKVGAAVTDIVKSTTTYARLGFDAETSNKLATYTAMLSKVGDIDTGAATSAVTAIVKAYDVQADELESIMDKLVVVGNNFPISVSELAEGMNNAGSALHAAGNEIEESLALLAAANTTVQNISKASTGLRTITARIRNMKTELDDLGEAMTEAEYENIVSALTKQHVALTDINGDFRSTYDILADIAIIWDELSSQDKAALAETLSGTRQQNVFFSIIESFNEATGAIDKMKDSQDELQKSFDVYEESVSYHMDRLKVSFTEIGQTLFQGSFLNGIIDFGNTLLTILNTVFKLLDALGGLQTVLLGVGAALVPIGISKILSGLVGIWHYLMRIPAQIAGIAEAIRTAYSLAQNGTRSFMSNLSMLMGSGKQAASMIGGIASIIGIVVGVIISVVQKIKQAQEEARQAAREAAEAFQKTSETVDEYKKKLDDLQNKLDDGNLSIEETIQVRHDLIGIQKDIIEKLGDEAGAFDAFSGSVKGATETLETFRQTQASTTLAQHPEYEQAATEFHSDRMIGIAPVGIKHAEEVGALLDQYFGDSVKRLAQQGSAFDVVFINDLYEARDALDAYGAALYQLDKRLEKETGEGLGTAYFDALTQASKQVDDWIDTWGELYDSYISLTIAADKDLHDIETGLAASQDKIRDAVAQGDLQKALDLFQEFANTDLSKVADDGIRAYFERIISAFRTEFGSLETVYDESSKRAEKGVQKLAAIKSKIDALMGHGGNVDLLRRKRIDITDDNLDIVKGWGMDAAVGDYMTVASQTYNDGDTAIVVTPILPNGELLTQDELDSYIDWLLKESSDGNYAGHDRYGIVMGVFGDGRTWNENLEAADRFAESVHNLNAEEQEMLEMLNALPYSAHELDEVIRQQNAELQRRAELNRDLYNETGNEGYLIAAQNLENQIADNNDALDLFKSLMDESNDSIQRVITTVQELTGSLSTLESDTGKLSSALNEFGENGTITAKTLADLAATFGDTDGFTDFINVVSDASTTTEQFEYACEELAARHIEQSGILDQVTENNAALIIRMLEGIGVTNADEVVTRKLIEAKLRLAISSIDAAEDVSVLIDALNNEKYFAELSKNELYALAAQQVATANTTMSFAQQISALEQLARQAGVAAASIAMLSKMPDPSEFGAWLAKRGMNGSLEEFQKERWLNAINAALQVDLRAPYTPVSTPLQFNYPSYVPTSTSTTDTDTSERTKEIEEYVAALDEYYKAKKRIDAVEQRLSKTEDAIAQAGSDAEKINLTQRLINIYEDEADALQNLNTLRTATIRQTIPELQALGFQISYNAQTNEFLIENMEHLNELQAQSQGSYETMQEATNALRKDTESLIGSLDDLNKENQEGDASLRQLTSDLREAKVAVIDYLKNIVTLSGEALDGLQSVHDTLHTAAEEYAESGYITVDTLQAVIGLGAQYMQYLTDENGMLVINHERIENVLRAKTQELALNEALAYVERLRLAMETDSIEDLNELLYATTDTTNATWGLVYANLALLNLDDDQYEAALHNINAIRAMAEGAMNSIGDVSKKAGTELETMKSGLDDILKYVMDMLKDRVQQQISDLEDMKKAFGDIIRLRKESLESAKKEADYQKDIGKKVKKIADLQAKISALSLDNSREATAKRIKLEEELSGLQEGLADTQADHAREAQENALDAMQQSYEDEKDAEIDALKDSISSTEKLYQKAIDYIRDHWSDLKDELIQWNYDVGTNFQKDIESAWEGALAAAERYGDYVTALGSIDADIAAESNAHHDTIGSASGGSDASTEDMIHAIIRRMWANAMAWSGASKERQAELNAANLELGARLAPLGINAIRDSKTGVWYVDKIGGEKLFEKYSHYLYHRGGIAGDRPSLRQNEVLAVLERGEAVLDERKERGLYRLVDFISALSNGVGKLLDRSGFSTMFGDGRFRAERLTGLATAGGPNIHFGDVYIYGGSEETVAKHREINREFTNAVLRQLNIKR